MARNDAAQRPEEACMATRTAVLAIAAGMIASHALGQTPQTHWEPYRNRAAEPSVDQQLTDRVLDGAIDLHAHYGPDSYPRQWDAFEIAALAQARGLRAVVFKNTGRRPRVSLTSSASTARRVSTSSAPSRSILPWAA